MGRTIVILGGALAGPTAAARAREYDEHARIVLVERNTHVSYGTTALAYRVSGEIASTGDLDREGPPHFGRRFDVDVRTRTAARALDVAERTVDLECDGVVERIAWDALVYALGVATEEPRGVGLVGENVRPLRTIHDLESLLDTLARGNKRVAVIGGGALGLEAVDGLVRAGAEVTLVERGDLLPRFGRSVRDAVARELAASIRLELGTTVVRCTAEAGRVVSLELANGRSVAVDYVVLAPGVRPRTELLAAAGVPLRADGSIAIDESAHTSAPRVYACGTCVAVPMRGLGNTWSAQAAIADKTAQVAGANAAGASQRFAPFVGSFVTRIGDLTVARTGMSHSECVETLGGLRVGRVLLHGSANEPALAERKPLLLELFFDRESGRVLGLEAAGRGAERRIDVAAVAIAGGVPIDDLAMLDFAYAPAFGSARDPLNVAATIALAKRDGLGKFVEDTAGRFVVDVGATATMPGGATHMPLETLRASAGHLDPNAPLVLVDETGRDSWLAQRILVQRGFADVAVLAGGTKSIDEPESR